MRFFNICSRVFMALLCLVQPCPSMAETLPDHHREQIEFILMAHHIPGAAVVLIDSSGMAHTSYFGMADMAAGIPVGDSTLFCVGSITKTFLAAGILLAEEKGMLSLQDPLAETLPNGWLKNEWAASGPVRLVHLLEHTSGIDEAHFHLAARANRDTPLKEVLHLSTTSLKTRWKPGYFAEYNTLGYIAAAHMLQTKTGTDLEDFMKQHLFGPSGLMSATYRPEKSRIYQLAKGYEADGETEIAFPGLPQWPAGALSMTAGDLAAFLQILMLERASEKRAVLKQERVVRMEAPETSLRARAGTVTGYGKGLNTTYYRGHLFHGHTGRYGGFLSDFGYSRKAGMGYVILVNNVDGQKALREIKSVLLKDALSASEGQSASLMPSNSNMTFRGAYQPVTGVPQLGKVSEFFMKIIDLQIVKADQEQVMVEGPLFGTYSLFHVRDRLFSTGVDGGPTVAFIENETGKSLMLTEDGAYRKIPVWQAYMIFYTAVVILFILISCFLIWMLRLPIRLIGGKTITAEWLPFLSICFMAAMVSSILTWYDPEALYSTGAVLFYLFGWLFLASALSGLMYGLYLLTQRRIGAWSAIFTCTCSLACSIMSLYLLFCGIIGLQLWSY